jgi:hypothetical protein
MPAPISDEQIEILKATYAETGVIRSAARAAHVSVSTAKKYVDSNDGFEQARTEKRLTIIDYIATAQVKLIESMVDAATLAKASLQEKAVAFGIVTDKGLLLTGQATSRSETITDPSARLTPDEMEAAARIREKFAAEVAV